MPNTIYNLCRMARSYGFDRILSSISHKSHAGKYYFYIQRHEYHVISQRNQHASVNNLTIAVTNYSTNDHLSKPTPSSANLPRIDLSAYTNSILASEKPSPISKLVKNGHAVAKSKWNSFFDWYDEVSHTNEIREAHKHVDRLQEELNDAQQRRREISKQLNDIRYELQLCYADLANCNKGEPRYLEIIRKEYEIHHKEKQKAEEFNQLDKAERDLFIHLQAAVKTSHEKEKIHTNSAKYWSIVGSLIGALLGIIGTAFSFYNRNDLLSDINKEFIVIRNETKTISEDIKKLGLEQSKNTELARKLEKLKRKLEKEKLENIALATKLKRDINATKSNGSDNNQESWLHWIGRKSYVISAYRYFVPKNY